jgi:hypothetical protein
MTKDKAKDYEQICSYVLDFHEGNDNRDGIHLEEALP